MCPLKESPSNKLPEVSNANPQTPFNPVAKVVWDPPGVYL